MDNRHLFQFLVVWPAIIYAILLLSLVTVILLGVTPLLPLRESLYIFVVSLAGWLGVYRLLATHHHRAARILGLVIVTLNAYGLVMMDASLLTFNFLILPVLFASVIFSIRTSFYFSIANMVCASLLAWAHLGSHSPSTAWEIFFFLAVGSLALWIVAYYRTSIEMDRKARILGIETAFQNLIEPSALQAIIKSDISPVEATRALKLSEERYKAIVEDQTELICRYKPDGTLTFVNGAFCRYFGKSSEELIGHSFLPSIYDEDRKDVQGWISAMSADNPTVTYEHRVYGLAGEIRWQQWTDRALFDEQGNLSEYQSIARDITDVKQAQDALRESEERFRVLVATQGEGIALIDPDLIFTFANPAAETIFGMPPMSLSNASLENFVDAEQITIIREKHRDLQRGKKATFEFGIIRPDGQTRSLLATVSPWLDYQGNITGVLAVFIDITERKNLEEQLRFVGTHDILTGLYNRSYFEEEITRLERSRMYPISVVMVDMDELKLINDHYGHQAGDNLLYRTALMLRSSFRNEDVVARIGGDEFVVLLPETGAEAARNAIERLRNNLDVGATNPNAMALSLSIGVATAAQGDALTKTIADADQDMYRHKRARKQRPLHPRLDTSHHHNDENPTVN